MAAWADARLRASQAWKRRQSQSWCVEQVLVALIHPSTKRRERDHPCQTDAPAYLACSRTGRSTPVAPPPPKVVNPRLIEHCQPMKPVLQHGPWRHRPAEPTGPTDIFLSVRFNEGLLAAQSLQHALELRGLRVFLCSVQAGCDLITTIAEHLDATRLVVILGTETYGYDTGSGCCTADELKYIAAEQKPFFLVKMCERFRVPLARFIFADVMYHVWKPTSGHVNLTPDPLVNSIAVRYHTLAAT
ncbi:uncharacterized protein MONBRDRAFT_39055 [Monosiga brevicollis MX1]|uniref:TIR domain-containing protein n=1 Tax=Monosiga brevicollis TaxID=81824 RepID=A9VBY0_MONBE|nr:uncharacterized protein MONBRDRAFT_39055 [Monosiga brevicollis MX1]EDQ84884.1 predicted protein [Monosiga brevicollis MX1]|eukprot:XP_001750225.1 hypothetical protein [Monosiga brevicollis MX1]